MSSNHLPDQAFQRFNDLGTTLDELLERASSSMPADRYRVLQSSGQKLIQSYERVGVQLGMFLDQHNRFLSPTKGPQRGPGTVHTFRPRRK